MVGSSGDLYLVEQLKLDLLKLNCDFVTVTLDMCRNEPVSEFSVRSKKIKPTESVRKVELRYDKAHFPQKKTYKLVIF